MYINLLISLIYQILYYAMTKYTIYCINQRIVIFLYIDN